MNLIHVKKNKYCLFLWITSRRWWWWWWLLLYSTILRSRADSLLSHMILHEWLAFYSEFLTEYLTQYSPEEVCSSTQSFLVCRYRCVCHQRMALRCTQPHITVMQCRLQWQQFWASHPTSQYTCLLWLFSHLWSTLDHFNLSVAPI